MERKKEQQKYIHKQTEIERGTESNFVTLCRDRTSQKTCPTSSHVRILCLCLQIKYKRYSRRNMFLSFNISWFS